MSPPEITELDGDFTKKTGEKEDNDFKKEWRGKKQSGKTSSLPEITELGGDFMKKKLLKKKIQ